MAETIDISKFGNTLVLYYGGKPGAIDIKTMTISISRIYEAIEIIYEEIYGEEEINICLEGVAPGSSKIAMTLKTDKKRAKRRTSKKNIAITVLVLAVIILANTHDGFDVDVDFDFNLKINSDNNTVIQHIYPNKEVIAPEEAYEYANRILQNEAVKKKILNCFKRLGQDSNMNEFGFSQNLKDKELVVCFSAEDIWNFNSAGIKKKTIKEEAELNVVRPVLKRNKGSRRSKKMWEFTWGERGGKEIKAPILGSDFYDEMEAKNLSFTSGDALHVVLEFHQQWNGSIREWVDTGTYKIIEVLEYTQGAERWRTPSRRTRPYG